MLNKRYLLLLLAVSFISFPLVAQEFLLQGIVEDSVTGEPLIGVTVELENGEGTVTNETGNYSLPIQTGTHTVVFSYIGYEKQETKINVTASNVSLSILLKQVTNELNLVVVTASRYEKNILRETVSMEVLKPDFISNTNSIDLDEAIEKVPGMTMIDNQVNVRGGSGFAYGAGSRVLVLVDDIPELTGDANDVKWEFLPVENIQQVEIIKGASSVLYGSSALNGVINIRTRYPTATPETRITAYQGLYQNPKDKSKAWWGYQQPYFGGANFSHSQKYGQFDLVLGGNLFNEQSFHEGEYTLRGRMNVNSRYRFKKIDGLAAGLNANFMNYHSGTYFLWADDTTGAYRALGGLDSATTTVAEGNNTRYTIDPFVSYFSKNGDHHNLRMRYFYTRNSNESNKSSTSKFYYGEYQYQRKLFFDINFIAGFSASYSDVVAELYGDHFANNLAAFTQLDKDFGRLNLVAGVRYETFKVDTAEGNSEPVFRAGANYQAGKSTFIRASFGQGYRFPSIAEKFVNTSVGALVVFPNPEVQAERGWSAELGIKQGFKVNDWLGFVDVAAFIQRYHDLIEFKFGYYHPNPIPGEYDISYLGFKSINIENARITGGEVSVLGQGSFFGITTDVLAGITYINPINVDQKEYADSLISNDQSLTPEEIDSLELTKILNYRFKTTFKINIAQSYKKFSWGAEVRYNSYMINIDPFFEGTDPLILFLFGEPVEFIPGVKSYREAHHHGDYVIDLRLSYDISNKIRLSFITKNLMNREYSIRPALLEAPRSYTVLISAKI